MAPQPQQSPRPRPHINVMMRCCRVYSRLVLSAAGDAYAGHCPRCAKPVRVPVGEGGSDSRFFEAG